MATTAVIGMKYWVSPVFSKRKRLGEFHHLHEDQMRNRKKFLDYYKMNVEAFKYILNAIQPSIAKWSNFIGRISHLQKC